MSTALIFLLLGSAFLHAVWNTIVKGGQNKLFEVSMKAGGACLCALLFIPFLPAPAPESWPYITASMCIHVLYYLFVAKAYKGADMSYAYTIMRGSAPLLTALVSVFILGNSLNGGGWVGVLLLSAAIFTLAADSVRHGCFRLAPTVTALANAFVIMGYTLVDGVGVRHSGSPVAYACWVFFANGFPIVTIAWFSGKGEYPRYLARRWKYGLFGGFCSFLAYGLSVVAMAYAPISLVAALRETSVIFGMLLAVYLLKEKFYLARAVSVLLVVAGTAAIKFFA